MPQAGIGRPGVLNGGTQDTRIRKRTSRSVLGDALVPLVSEVITQGPDGKLGAIRQTQLAENAIEVLFDGAFGQMQLVGDFFVQLGLRDQVYNLFLPKTELRTKALLSGLREPASGTNSVATILAELVPAAETISKGVDCRKFTIHNGYAPNFRCHLEVPPGGLLRAFNVSISTLFGQK